MKVRLRGDIPDQLLQVCATLQTAGFEAVLVGGCVRDMYLGREPKDWDVATSAWPVMVQKLFERTVPTGLKHGTVTIIMGGEMHIEVTTYRTDGVYGDGRHPDEVKLGVTLLEDLSRRDFTMNAIAYDPISRRTYDPFGGRLDIKDKTIMAVGVAKERFQEDGLRMMRAVRFAATLGFELEQDTRMALRNSLGFLDGVSSERLRDELIKMMGAEKPSVGLRLAAVTGLLWKVIPELAAQVGHAQNSHHMLDIWYHTCLVVDSLPPDPILRIAGLIHDVAKPACAESAYGPGEFSFHGHHSVGADMARGIVEGLKFSNTDKDRICHLVQHHMAMFGFDPDTTDKTLRKFIKRVGVGSLPDIMRLTIADVIGKGSGEDAEARFGPLRERLWGIMTEIANGGAAVEKSQLAINGKILMADLNLSPGPRVGELLKMLLERVMDNPELNTPSSLLELAKEMPGE